MTLYVVVQERPCEYGPPQGIFSTLELANAFAEKCRQRERDNNAYEHSFLVWQFQLDDQSGARK